MRQQTRYSFKAIPLSRLYGVLRMSRCCISFYMTCVYLRCVQHVVLVCMSSTIPALPDVLAAQPALPDSEPIRLNTCLSDRVVTGFQPQLVSKAPTVLSSVV